jgi:hypothetical protein
VVVSLVRGGPLRGGAHAAGSLVRGGPLSGGAQAVGSPLRGGAFTGVQVGAMPFPLGGAEPLRGGALGWPQPVGSAWRGEPLCGCAEGSSFQDLRDGDPGPHRSWVVGRRGGQSAGGAPFGPVEGAHPFPEAGTDARPFAGPETDARPVAAPREAIPEAVPGAHPGSREDDGYEPGSGGRETGGQSLTDPSGAG